MKGRGLPVAILLLFATAPLAAQQVDVVASVPQRSPLSTGVRDLTFGPIMPTAVNPQTVIVAAAVAPVSGTVQSGAFRYDVANLRGLDFTLAVPLALISPAGDALPVASAGTQYGGYCVGTPAATCTLTSFDPSASSVRVCRQQVGGGNCHPNNVFPANSELSIYVGGMLTVPPMPHAGTYTGVVTMTILQVY